MVDERFVGAWELAGTETRDAQGRVVSELFPGWSGQIVYSADGYMSVHLMGGERPFFTNPDRLAATPEQKQQAFDTYIGYYGTFSVDAAGGVVTHHVRGASLPTMVGADLPRTFQHAGDRLTLSAPPEHEGDPRSYLIWRRVRSQSRPE